LTFEEARESIKSRQRRVCIDPKRLESLLRHGVPRAIHQSALSTGL
jgi:hypothetical protein